MVRFWRMFLGLVGVAMLVGGLVLGATRLAFRARSHTAEGVVSGLAAEESKSTRMGRAETSRSYHPEVRWTDAAGREHRFIGGIGDSIPQYSVGERVRIRYDPSQPQAARIDTFWELWLGPLS